MSKISTILATFICLFLSTAVFAQPEFFVQPQDPNANVGDTVVVDVKVNDFVLLQSFQYSVNWNQSLLEYVEIINTNSDLGMLPPPAPLNFGIANVNMGQLSVIWSDADLSGESLTDSTILFSIRLEVLGTGGATSTVSISDNPTVREIIDQNFNDITNTTTFTNGPATEEGYNNPPPPPFNPCDTSSVFNLIAQNDTVPTGDPVCLDVYACNWTDIVSASYTMDYNPSVLQFNSIENLNLDQLTLGSFGTTNPGFITFSWIDSTGNGVTVPAGTAIYQVCFTAIGPGGSVDTLKFTDSLTDIEITDANSNGAHIGMESSGGEVTISGMGSSALTLNVSSATAENGDNVCLDVKVQNFEMISGLQYSMGWDPTILSYDQIIITGNLTPLSVPGNFNTSTALTDQGKLTLSWNTNLANGTTVPDDSTIYRVCFDVIGSAGQTSNVSFTDDPSMREALQEDGMGNTSQVPMITTNGNVQVIGAGGFELHGSDETGATGDTVCVDISTRGFNNLVATTYSFEWDDSVLDFIEIRNNILPPSTNTNLDNSSKFTIQWQDVLVSGVTLSDDTIMFEACFEIIGANGTSSPITFTNTPTQNIEILQNDAMGNTSEIPASLFHGSVNVQNGSVLTITQADLTHLDCNGDSDGAIDITVSGGASPYTFAWSNSEATEDISGLIAGDYTVTITDAMSNTVTETYTITEPGAISFGSTFTEPTCNGDSDGSIDITVGSGTPPYTFAWSNSETTEDLSNIPAGDYTVTITDDNGCTIVETVTVTEPDELALNATVVNAGCGSTCDGSVTLNVTGGTAPYTYDWSIDMFDGSDAATGLCAGTINVRVTDANGCFIVMDFTINQASAISASATATDVSCGGAADGSIDLTVTGGTPPFAYAWDNGAGSNEDPSGLSGTTTYCVTVTDHGGCTATACATVNEPTAISTNPTITDLDCNGAANGSISLAPTGGTGPYTYLWDYNNETTATISGLDAGNYDVTITDDNGCTRTATYSVDEPSAINISASVTSESAFGAMDGAIDLTVSGGTPAYTFNWNPGGLSTEDLSMLSPGQYDVTVTDDNGCTSTMSFTVNSGDAPEITVESVTHPACNGSSNGSIDISVTGGTSPYMFQWDDNSNSTTEDINGLPAGTYSVTVTDQNSVTAVISSPVVLTNPTDVTINFNKTDASCPGVSDGSFDVAVSGGNGPYTYNWDNGLTPNGQSAYTGLAAGTYNGTVTDANFCTAMVSITISEPSAISLNNAIVTDALCANEASGAIDITVTGGAAPYTFAWNDSNNSMTEDLSNIFAGDYVVTITDSNGCTAISNLMSVDEGAAIVITVDNVVDASCPGVPDGSIDITVSGGSPNYSFEWFNNVDMFSIAEDVAQLRGGTYTVIVTDARGCQVTSPPVTVLEPNALDINATITNTSIQNDDGAITINVSGGNQPYTYNWSGPSNNFTSMNEDIFGLMPGYYYLTVTDDEGCNTKMDSLLVEGVVFAIADVTNVSCNGQSDGKVDVTIMGGIPPFTYQWSNGLQIEDLTNLPAGPITLTITDNAGSEFIETFIITEPPALVFQSIDVTPNSGNGNNGAINITMAGGTPAYTYQWSTGATSEDLIAVGKGEYDVTVTDSKGCIAIRTGIVVAPAPLTASVDAKDATCDSADSGEATVSMIGGCEPYEITITNGTFNTMITTLDPFYTFTGLPIGSYTGLVEDLNNSTFNISFQIGGPTPIAITVDNIVNNMDETGSNCTGAIAISVNGGTPPYNYQWSNGAMVEDVSGLCEDISPYSVTVTDANGCVTILDDILMRRISIDVVDIKCANECNGEIRLDVNGGGNPFQYIWADGATGRIRTGLCAGEYTVTILDAMGNVVHTTTEFVEAPPSPLTLTLGSSVQPTGTNKNGSIDINVSGGWGNYMFTWTGPDIVLSGSEDQVALGGGVYNVIVTDDKGCQVSLPINLEAIVIVLGNVEMASPSCSDVTPCDGSIEVDNVSGGVGPYTYNWSNEQSGPVLFEVCAGQYFVTITDAQGLSGVFGPFELSDPEPISLDYIKPGDCSATVLISGGTAPYEIMWNTPNADTTARINVNDVGPYAVIVTDANQCIEIDNNVLVTCDEINNPENGICSDVRVAITPNGDGDNDNFVIRCTENVVMHLEVYNRYGQLVYRSTNYDNNWEGTDADGDRLPEGGYFYVLEYDDAGVQRQEKGHLTIIR